MRAGAGRGTLGIRQSSGPERQGECSVGSAALGFDPAGRLNRMVLAGVGAWWASIARSWASWRPVGEEGEGMHSVERSRTRIPADSRADLVEAGQDIGGVVGVREHARVEEHAVEELRSNLRSTRNCGEGVEDSARTRPRPEAHRTATRAAGKHHHTREQMLEVGGHAHTGDNQEVAEAHGELDPGADSDAQDADLEGAGARKRNAPELDPVRAQWVAGVDTDDHTHSALVGERAVQGAVADDGGAGAHWDVATGAGQDAARGVVDEHLDAAREREAVVDQNPLGTGRSEPIGHDYVADDVRTPAYAREASKAAARDLQEAAVVEGNVDAEEEAEVDSSQSFRAFFSVHEGRQKTPEAVSDPSHYHGRVPCRSRVPDTPFRALVRVLSLGHAPSRHALAFLDLFPGHRKDSFVRDHNPGRVHDRTSPASLCRSAYRALCRRRRRSSWVAQSCSGTPFLLPTVVLRCRGQDPVQRARAPCPQRWCSRTRSRSRMSQEQVREAPEQYRRASAAASACRGLGRGVSAHECPCECEF